VSQAFPKTHWSWIEQGPDALGRIFEHYRTPILAYLTRFKRVRRQEAEDVLHAFLARVVVERELLDRADRQKGMFRTFLIHALNDFLVDERRHAQAKKRTPTTGQVLPLAHRNDLIGDDSSPLDVYEMEWARQVLAHTLERVREECENSGRREVWRIFEARVIAPCLEGTDTPSYERLVDELGLESPSQASNRLITAKRIFERQLRVTVGEYTSTPDDIEREIADLRRILARGPA